MSHHETEAEQIRERQKSAKKRIEWQVPEEELVEDAGLSDEPFELSRFVMREETSCRLYESKSCRFSQTCRYLAVSHFSCIVGKHLLELLSSSMYIDPMTIFREYIQNASDSIDEARKVRLLSTADPGQVDLFVDPNSRTVRIRDNGVGISHDQFQIRLTGFGTSLKRGTEARGFRGVGRLAGLGYCQELLFRSRASGEADVNEMRWM